MLKKMVQKNAFNGEIPGVSDIDAGLNIGTSFFITEHLDIDLNAYIGMMGFENVDEGYQRTSLVFLVDTHLTNLMSSNNFSISFKL